MIVLLQLLLVCSTWLPGSSIIQSCRQTGKSFTEQLQVSQSCVVILTFFYLEDKGKNILQIFLHCLSACVAAPFVFKYPFLVLYLLILAWSVIKQPLFFFQIY